VVWALLVVAIVSEVAATGSLKAAGAGSVPAMAVVALGYAGSIALLALVVRSLEVGVVYAIWAGTGTAIVALLGILAFGESVTVLKTAGLVCIVMGVVALNLAGSH
jgi:small multidrug resistance pump